METIITFNEIISPVPRVLIFISHSHFLLNLTKGYWGWQENNSGLLLLGDNKSGAQKLRTMPPSQRILYNYTAIVMTSWKLILLCFALCFSVARLLQ